METLLTSAPWWLLVVVIFGVALYISGWKAAITAAVCLALIALLGLWEHSMQTLVTVLVATALTMVIGISLGILAANNDRASTAMRPFLDAAQTMPAFVYLLPALALFSASRFTAIVAALIFAVPPVIRLVENGIRNVPATVVEAATAAGSDRRQLHLEGAAAGGQGVLAAGLEPGHRPGPLDGRRRRPGGRRGAGLRRRGRLLATG